MESERKKEFITLCVFFFGFLTLFTLAWCFYPLENKQVVKAEAVCTAMNGLPSHGQYGFDKNRSVYCQMPDGRLLEIERAPALWEVIWRKL